MVDEGWRVDEVYHVSLSLASYRLADFEPLFVPLSPVPAMGSNLAAGEIELGHELLGVAVL